MNNNNPKSIDEYFNYSSNKDLLKKYQDRITDTGRRQGKRKKTKGKVKGKIILDKPVYTAINNKTGIIIKTNTIKELQNQLQTKTNINKIITSRKQFKNNTIIRFINDKEYTKFFDKYKKDDNKFVKLKQKDFLEEFYNKNNADLQHKTIKYKLNFDTQKFNNNNDINSAFSLGIAEALLLHKDTDKIRLVLSNPGKKSAGASIPYMYIKNFKEGFFKNGYIDFDYDEVIKESDTEFSLSSNTILTISIQTNPYAGGRGKIINNKRDIYTKKSLLKINNKDDLCLGRCIVCEIEKLNKHPQILQIRMGRKIQTELAHKLYEDACVEKTIATLESIKQFEKYLDISITIIDGDQFNNVIYPDTESKEYQPKDINVYLYKTQNHYDLINSKSIAGFFGKTYFCKNCKKPHSSPKHKCNWKCNICCSSDCDSNCFDFKANSCSFDCKSCLRWFPTEKCKTNHLTPDTKGKSVCDKVWKCPDCKKIMDREKFIPSLHKCGDFECRNCNQIVDKDHKCYMFPKPIKEFSQQYIYFDFECDIISGDEHIPNFCVAEYHTDDKKHIFYTVDEFCEWVFQDIHDKFTLIAHNGRGYDFQLIMRWIYKHTTYKPFSIYAGSKIMTFSVKGQYEIRFVDSLNFLTMKLEDFPGTFGIKELKKGFYPYWFNCEKNWNYVGVMPDKKYYKPNNMSADIITLKKLKIIVLVM